MNTVRTAGSEVQPTRRGVGICLGASTVSVIQVEVTNLDSGPSSLVIAQRTAFHDGNVRAVAVSLLTSLDLASSDRIFLTGRRFGRGSSLPFITEAEALELAYRNRPPGEGDCNAVISLGGETTMIYQIDRDGRISNAFSGNKCASGTGEFFLQQARRLGFTPEEAIQCATIEKPYPLSGRCAVFCKSDCTHACNKGVPRARVMSGVARMMADKILALRWKIPPGRTMLVGGGIRNRMLVHYLEESLDGVEIPEHAAHFEALGAALLAVETGRGCTVSVLVESFRHQALPWGFRGPLTAFDDLVTFKSSDTGKARPGDRCVLGLDVGSTTTKAVLMRLEDQAVLASVYLRTTGDPLAASRACYSGLIHCLERDLGPTGDEQLEIVGLGVTGSGRQISGLQAGTPVIVNEIIAHARAATHYEPAVDTIIEIGGQDAKYTFLSNSVPLDYAMNDACCAGTGSFLEEAAGESLGVKMTDIARMARRARRAPDFNDQCAAFIGSDIKNAIQEGISSEEVLAGLVYAICQNYESRVRGNRPMGKVIFMQGGVCYNQAVPLAMAGITGKAIVVPPEPGLTGALGAALEVGSWLRDGRITASCVSLRTLSEQPVASAGTFTCQGVREACDRRCEIALFDLGGKRHPFGGACNKYYNLRRHVRFETSRLNLVNRRQKLIFEPNADSSRRPRGRVGILSGFMMHSYLPMIRTFFDALGFEPVLSASAGLEGVDRCNAPFCYPAELAHGMFYSLLQRSDLDFIFVPHIRGLPVKGGYPVSRTCPIAQAAPYYLSSTFRTELSRLAREQGTRFVTGVIDLTGGLENGLAGLADVASQMGAETRAVRRAFRKAVTAQLECEQQFLHLGNQALRELEAEPSRFAVVLFGRPYSAFAGEAHQGIPLKFSSRGVQVIPFDFFPIADEPDPKPHLYWGMGQSNLRIARFVRDHPQLFAVWVTNFSCGPDSFLLGYFRELMGRKPALVLELDSHTADAGLETRIEAFLEVVLGFRQRVGSEVRLPQQNGFRPARVDLSRKELWVTTSGGRVLRGADPAVTLVFPSMGRLSSEAVAAGVRAAGYRAVAAPPADRSVLELGRRHTTSKECLPLILAVGTLLESVEHQKNDEVVLYFMPTANGPCRFGQYHVFLDDLIRRRQIRDVVTFSLSSANGYGGLGSELSKRIFWGTVIADLMEDIRSLLLANAVDPSFASNLFEQQFRKVTSALERERWDGILKALQEIALELGSIPGRIAWDEVPRVSLLGEIFVRRDDLCRQNLTERLAKEGFAVHCAHVSEWINYCQIVAQANQCRQPLKRLETGLRRRWMARAQRKLRDVLSGTGLVLIKPEPVESLLKIAAPYLNRKLGTEALLTVGSSLHDAATVSSGVIAIGPFGCMPNRISEAILSQTMRREAKLKAAPQEPNLATLLWDEEQLPFLAIESDGRRFPQATEARLEAFLLRVRRLHLRMLEANCSVQSGRLRKGRDRG